MNLSKLTSLLTKYLRVFTYGARVRPLRDWIAIVSVALLLLIVSAGWSAYVFQTTSGNESTQPSAPVTSSAAGAPIDTVRAIFERRAVEKSHYLSDYHFVDPSR
ncbi:MAG: hypothetical protein JWL82_103 [Parcubacteria group bacterium]|nr:hypothetical protein [Parcubacteria group bacterium]